MIGRNITAESCPVFQMNHQQCSKQRKDKETFQPAHRDWLLLRFVITKMYLSFMACKGKLPNSVQYYKKTKMMNCI